MIVSSVKAVAGRLRAIRSIEERCKAIQQSLGRIEARQLENLPASDLRGAEFRAFSQWGQDGILQHLLRHVPVQKNIFIEFGVEDYSEANTRFLLVNNNWAGLVIDGSSENIQTIRQQDIYWRHNLKADQAFITRENINQLILRNGISGEIGVLSIDIDGNDYWVWEKLDAVLPSIVIIEYNSRFGPDKAVTIPYDAEFVRTKAHHSNLYFGASLAALCALGKRKGYCFVGCNAAGNDAFFVHSELKPASLPELTSREGFVRSQARESRDPAGRLIFLTDAEEALVLQPLPLVDVSQY